MKSIGILSLFLFSTTIAEAQETSHPIRHVSAEEFRHLIDSLKGEIVIDLRTPDELKQGKISGSLEIDYFGANFEPALKALDKNKIYLLYCAAGGRSRDTAELMDEMGFKKVYNLESGFKGWMKKKMPVSDK